MQNLVPVLLVESGSRLSIHPWKRCQAQASFWIRKNVHGGVEAHWGQKQGQMTRLSTQGANVGKIHRRIKGARTVT